MEQSDVSGNTDGYAGYKLPVSRSPGLPASRLYSQLSRSSLQEHASVLMYPMVPHVLGKFF